jgi:hypothetical protein
LRTLFANLNMQQKEKLNELISAIHEKDDLLDTQEDLLIKENKKHVKVKNAYALEVEKCEKLSSELSTCHECHTRFQGVEPSAYHMCARIHFHTYVDVTSVIYQKTMQ